MGRGLLQRTPTIPLERRRANNVPEEAAPFHEGALNIAVPERFVRHPITSRRGVDQFANDFRCARPVVDGHAHFQITGMIGPAINSLAKNSEPAPERRVLPGKAGARPDVGQIENEIADGIRFVFERGSDGQTFTGLEEGENGAAPGRAFRFP